MVKLLTVLMFLASSAAAGVKAQAVAQWAQHVSEWLRQHH